MTEKLSDETRGPLLTPLFEAGWSLTDDRDAIAKTFVFDDDRTFIGSINLDGRSLIQNTEVGLLIHSAAINQQLSQVFEDWIQASSAWQLGLDDKGDLQWKAANGNQPIRIDHDPETSAWQRFKVWSLSLLPIESQI